MKINYLSGVGRVLFAVPFLVLGLNHFLMIDYFIGMLNSFFPGRIYTILLTGALLVACSISIMIKKYVQLCCYILAVLLVLFILVIHIPGMFLPGFKEMAFFALLKDTGLLGGTLIMAAFYEKEETVQNKYD